MVNPPPPALFPPPAPPPTSALARRLNTMSGRVVLTAVVSILAWATAATGFNQASATLAAGITVACGVYMLASVAQDRRIRPQ